MERGVVVGGLMICGSFLLAALLNRSAMEEVPAPATPPAVVVSPVVVPAPRLDTAPDCAEMESQADAGAPSESSESARSDLMVNGIERCRR